MLIESSEAEHEVGTLIRRALGRLGRLVWDQWAALRHAAAVIGTVLSVSVRPRSWVRPVRTAFAQQVMAIGVEPLGFVGVLAAFVGLSVVVQLSFWTGETGQSQLLGPLLVAIVARELGPLLINLVVIVRSGTAMTTTLGLLKTNGEVRALEAQGNDPLRHLVLPRVLGMLVATLGLTIVFILVALASGYLLAAGMGKGTSDLWLFADTVSSAIERRDIFNILAKSILPALFAGAACCIGGLNVTGSVADTLAATQRALTRSVIGLFVISALVSLLTYL